MVKSLLFCFLLFSYIKTEMFACMYIASVIFYESNLYVYYILEYEIQKYEMTTLETEQLK